MTTEELKKKQAEMPDLELIEKSDNIISKLAKTGGRNHTMNVPPDINDTDMLLSELVRRFKNQSKVNLSNDNRLKKLMSKHCSGLDNKHKETYYEFGAMNLKNLLRELLEIKSTVKEEVKETGWISVKDELPKKEGKFVCKRVSGIINVENFYPSHPENWTKFTMVQYWLNYDLNEPIKKQ